MFVLLVTLLSADKLSFENEDGTIMAEEIFQEALLSYRPIPPPHQLPDCPPEQARGAAAAAAAAAPPAGSEGASAAKPTAGAAGRGAGRGSGRGAAAGGRVSSAGGKSTEASEARAKQLAAEAEVRSKVVAVRNELSRGLAALAAAAAGDRAFTAEQVGCWQTGRPAGIPA
jgi:hypothetical protein